MAPKGWKRAAINALCESIVDCVNKTAPTVDEVTPFKMIRTTNVRDGWVSLNDVKYVTQEVYEKWTRRQVPRCGDVILTREAPLGEVGLLRADDRIFLGQRLVAYRADPKKLDNRFLLYAFQSQDVQAQIRALGSGATVEHMRVPDAEKLTVCVPTLAVQRRIGDILSAYDDLIENNQKRISILDQMACSLYREWFVENPNGNRSGHLGDVVTLQRGFDLPERDRRAGSVPIVSSSGTTGWHDSAKAAPPGIVTGRYGTLGKVFLLNVPFWPLNTTLFVKDFKGSNPYWVLHLLTSLNFQTQDSAGAVPGVNRNALHLMPIRTASAKEQASFGAFVGPLHDQMDRLRLSNEKLAAQRDLLLPRLLSGEIDVSNLPDPAA